MIDYEVEVQVRALVYVKAKSAAEAERVVASMEPDLVLNPPSVNELENADATYRQWVHRIEFSSTHCKECDGRYAAAKSRICWPCQRKKREEEKEEEGK